MDGGGFGEAASRVEFWLVVCFGVYEIKLAARLPLPTNAAASPFFRRSFSLAFRNAAVARAPRAMSGFHSIFSPSDNIVRSNFVDLGPPDKYTDSDPRKEGKLYDKEELLDRALASTRRLGATVAAGGSAKKTKKATPSDRSSSAIKLVGTIVRAVLAKKKPKGRQVNRKKPTKRKAAPKKGKKKSIAKKKKTPTKRTTKTKKKR